MTPLWSPPSLSMARKQAQSSQKQRSKATACAMWFPMSHAFPVATFQRHSTAWGGQGRMAPYCPCSSRGPFQGEKKKINNKALHCN